MSASRATDTQVGVAAPWLALYDEGVEPEITSEHESCLAMFEAALERSPELEVIQYFETPMTLRRLDELSSGLAVGMSDLGVGREDRVALYLQNVPQFLIGLVAAWKLGAIGVPCNPMLRERELSHQLADSGAVVLICLEGLYHEVAAAVVPDSEVRAVITTSELDCLDQDLPSALAGIERNRPGDTHDLLELAEANAGTAPDPVELGPEDTAILTYTSGTTGPPKGARNTHWNIVFVSQVFRDWYAVTDRDVVIGVAPLFHITGLTVQVGLALCAPVPVVLSYRFDPAETLRLIERHRVTLCVGAITVYLALLKDEALDRYDISSLTKANSGGAPIPPAVIDEFEQRTGIAIRSAYGLTEVTGPSHLTPASLRPPVDEETGAIAVGIPVSNTVVRILDDDGQPLPPGEVGEVGISGPQVIPGYWNKPEETANAIRDGELRTGDVAKMDEDGWLYIVDRKKDLIIASGYNIWPREVEDVLYQHPAVHEAAVIGAPDEYRGEAVHAFVSLKPGEGADADELRAFCRERMAAYKCPRVINFIDELPKTVSGKILRRELRG